MSAITIGNDLVHYEVLGRGKPVVLVHSWLGSWRYWIPTMQQLGVNYRTYALDLWGFGDSGKNREHYHLEGQVALLRAFVEKMGIPKAVFLGHGLGAAVVAHYAIDPAYRSKVHRMMVVAPPLFDNAPALSSKRALAAPQKADAPTIARVGEGDIDRNKLREAALAAGLMGLAEGTKSEGATTTATPTATPSATATTGTPKTPSTPATASATPGTNTASSPAKPGAPATTTPATPGKPATPATPASPPASGNPTIPNVATPASTPPPSIPPATPATKTSTGDLMAVNPLTTLLGDMNPTNLLSKHMDTSSSDYEKLKSEVAKISGEVIEVSTHSFRYISTYQELLQISIPTLTVFGEKDTLIPVPEQNIMNRLSGGSNSKVIVLPGSRHFPMLEDTPRFVRLLREFLEATDVANLELKDEWRRRTR